MSEQAIPVLGFAATAALAADQMRAGNSVLILGSPGIGKSALADLIARLAKRVLATVIGSNCEPTDIGGLPIVAADGTLRRVPLPEIAACVEPGHLLFLDELTGVPPSVQQPLLRLALERVAGALRLHPDTWILAAANRPEEAPAAQEISAALGNRFCQIDMRPTGDEVASYIATIGEPGSALREAAVDWAATVRAEPRILQLSPPEESIQAGLPYASPRQIERGLRGWVVSRAAGRDEEICQAALAGCWGERPAATYLGILKYRDHLPTEAELIADPAGCKCPPEPHYQIAALGLLARVSATDSNVAWIYCARLSPEMSMAATRTLMGCAPSRGKSPHATAGAAAKRKCLAEVSRAIRGAA